MTANLTRAEKWAVTCDFQQCGILTSVDEHVQSPFKLRTSKRCSVSSFTLNIQATNKGSDQSGRMRRLIWAFAGCTYHIIGNIMSRLKCKIIVKPGIHKMLVRIANWEDPDQTALESAPFVKACQKWQATFVWNFTTFTVITKIDNNFIFCNNNSNTNETLLSMHLPYASNFHQPIRCLLKIVIIVVSYIFSRIKFNI